MVDFCDIQYTGIYTLLDVTSSHCSFYLAVSCHKYWTSAIYLLLKC